MNKETMKSLKESVMPHEFEEAGLGRAPFSLDSYREDVAGSSCDFCDRPIKYVFVIRSSDGRLFEVGSTCVLKTSDSELRRAVEERVAELKALSQERRIVNVEQLLARPDVLAKLEQVPTPSPWASRQGETAKDWCEWMMQNSGVSGKMKVVRFLEKFDWGV